MSLRKQISITSTVREINKAKIGKNLDLSILMLYNIYKKLQK